MKHFSMIRSFQLADFFTLANAACGALMVFLAAAYIGTQSLDTFMLAAAMAPAALVFDVLDGRIARWRHQASALGRELDSLADVISFGVGPATLAYAGGMRGGWDVAILIFFVCCGVSRLARYNVTAESLSAGSAKVPYFEGTPIPTSVFLVLLMSVAAWQERLGEQMWFGATTLGPWGLHPLSLAFLASGSLMISTIRIPKL
ncbi:CDP-alcohol phosphatidyltransferase family protein [Piscinibacter terrae]|nr:CDP-alcohol phosphatidyltransferase family protein [Albitalea terrae]